MAVCYHGAIMLQKCFARTTIPLFALAILTCLRQAVSDEPARLNVRAATSAKPNPDRPFGIEKRAAWTTSRFRGSPDPPPPYRAERVFPKLHFKNPTVLTNA